MAKKPKQPSQHAGGKRQIFIPYVAKGGEIRYVVFDHTNGQQMHIYWQLSDEYVAMEATSPQGNPVFVIIDRQGQPRHKGWFVDVGRVIVSGHVRVRLSRESPWQWFHIPSRTLYS